MQEKLRVAMFGHKRWSREGGIEVVVKELCTRMVQNGCLVTCYNRSGHHVSGAKYDNIEQIEYAGIHQKFVPAIEHKGLVAVSSAFFAWIPKMFDKRVLVTIHGECEIIRGCHNRDKGTAEKERLRDPKFIFSYTKNERRIFLNGRNAAQKEISTMRGVTASGQVSEPIRYLCGLKCHQHRMYGN